MTPEPQVTDTKEVYVSWTNTDLTEGRGHRIPWAVCETLATAEREGRGQDVQGSDCPVTKETAVQIDGIPMWLGPVEIHKPTLADVDRQSQIDASHAARAKAWALGMTEAELAALLRP